MLSRTALAVSFVLAVLVVGFTLAPSASAARDSRLSTPTASMASAGATQSAARQITRLVNAERRRAGLRPLRTNRRLATAARRHARNMVRQRFFSHTSPSGKSPSSRILAAGYARRGGYFRYAENLAWGTGSRATPKSIVRAWMRSPGHRRNILDGRLREAGVGISRGVPGTSPSGRANGLTYVQEFGSRTR
jgi:uncharacterized protein YkwD